MKIRKSKADVWVFVIVTWKQKEHYLLIPIEKLRALMPRSPGKIWHLYLSILEDSRCYQTRDLKSAERQAMTTKAPKDKKRDFSQWLERCDLLE